MSVMWHGRHDLVPLASPGFSGEQAIGGGCASRNGKCAVDGADEDEDDDGGGGSAKMG